MNLLFIGDVVGKGGRKAIAELVPKLKKEFKCDIVIINAENSAAGSGTTLKCARTLYENCDVITMGDHTWDQKGFVNDIEQLPYLIRPANFSKKQPGKGFYILHHPKGEIAVINLQGQVFMKEVAYSPFEIIDEILESLPKSIKSIFVDFHAEATSEKIAMGYYLDGRVTAVIGTHTHVQTADAKILKKGSAFMCDVGMVGADESVIGRNKEAVISKFVTGMPNKFLVIEDNIRLDACIISFDSQTGIAKKIQNISRMSNASIT